MVLVVVVGDGVVVVLVVVVVDGVVELHDRGSPFLSRRRTIFPLQHSANKKLMSWQLY